MTRWRGGMKRCGMGATLGAFAVATLGSMTAARPASAQDIERVLAGIRLNTKSGNVLAKYGNPNEVVIGDVGVRGTGPNGGQGGGGVPGDGGGSAPGGYPGPGTGGLPGFGSKGGGGGRSTSSGGSSSAVPGAPGGGPPPGFGGPPGGFGGPPGGGFGAPPGGEGDGPGGFGSGGFGSGPSSGASSGAVGPFGQSVSTLAREQEVTWIYNRKVNNNLVSYNFLIGPNGNVVQILVSGYSGGNSKTKRGIGLGSTYKDVVKAYGFPEDHALYGRTLVASYRTKAHASFQFQLETPQSNPLASGNKVIGITIATVE